MLNLEADLVLDTGTYRLIQRVGNDLHLQNRSSEERIKIHLGDLAPRLLELPPTPSALNPRALDHLTTAQRAQVNMWATHIEEMISGRRPDLASARSQYDPTKTTLNQRVATKSLELEGFGISAKRSTLYEKKALYVAGGPAALLDGRANKRVGPLDRADVRLIETIVSVVSRRTQMSTITELALHKIVQAELIVRYGSGAPTLPSRATLYRYFGALYDGSHTAKATTRRSVAGTPNRTYGTSRRMIPGQEVQVDSTTMDVFVRTKSGPQRPILTKMIDVATRTVLAFTIRLNGSKGYDHALLLTQALVPFSQRPNRTIHRALVAAEFPQITLLPPEKRALLEQAHPIITPRSITTDNGKDYLSLVFQSACKKFNIDIVRSSIHTPTDKSHVERNFGSINTLFCQTLSAYTGDSVANKGRNPEKQDLLDVAALTELFEDWLLSEWQHRKHNGLRDLYDTSQTFTPNQWFNSMAPFAGEVSIPLSTDDFIDLLPSTLRVIGTTGVQIGNRLYDSVELHPFRGMPSNIPSQGHKWRVKYNPFDVGRLWVQSPKGEWIECPWRLADAITQPHFADVTAALRRTDQNDIAFADTARAGTPMPGSSTPAQPAPLSLSDWDSIAPAVWDFDDDEEE
jgi:putative transposase